MDKKIIAIIITLIVLLTIMYNSIKTPTVEKLKNMNESDFEISNMYGETTYSYTIVKNPKDYKKLTKKSLPKYRFNNYNYMIIEIDRGPSCDTSLNIEKVTEKKKSINLDIKVSNSTVGCMRSTPRYFSIPINKKIKSGIEVVLNEV